MKKYILLILVISLFSCAKEAVKGESAKSWARIENPLFGSSYSKGDTITLIAQGNSEVQQHGYSFTIKEATSDSIIYYSAIHVHGLSITANEQWVNNFNHPTNLLLIFTIYENHNGITAADSINFFVQ